MLSVSTGIRIDIITHARWFVQHPKQALYQTEPRPDIELKKWGRIVWKESNQYYTQGNEKKQSKNEFYGNYFLRWCGIVWIILPMSLS